MLCGVRGGSARRMPAIVIGIQPFPSATFYCERLKSAKLGVIEFIEVSGFFRPSVDAIIQSLVYIGNAAVGLFAH